MAIASNIQIVQAFEALKMSTEEIADALDYPIEGVKMVLASESALYRQAVQAPDSKETFTDYDKELAKKTMVSLMQSSDVDAVRYRTAKYILDDKAGRHDVNKLTGTNISITLINERLQQAREALELARGKTIDVKSDLVSV